MMAYQNALTLRPPRKNGVYGAERTPVGQPHVNAASEL